jgi:hypothetical protein
MKGTLKGIFLWHSEPQDPDSKLCEKADPDPDTEY